MTTLFPTNTCFDDALDYILAMVKEYRINPNNEHRYKICHGILLGSDKKPYSHAWVEFDDDVIISGIWNGSKVYATGDRKEYYREVRVTSDVTKYTLQEVLAMNRKYCTYGPWVDRYLDLTRDAMDRKMDKK